MKYVQPTDQEIRERIEQIKEKDYRMVYKYQYEILGRISEVAGKYMPRYDQHRVMEFNGEEFVMFIVKTAKRKGYLRPCARPLDTKYDPWTKEILDYIESGEEYPFALHDNWETSKTYAMEKARKVFDGMYWPMSDYTRAMPRQYTKDMVKTERWGNHGYKEYLVFFPDGERSWTKDEEIAYINMKIEPRWRPVTSHVLRKISQNTLMNTYGLDDVDCAYFGGWTVTGQRTGVSQSMGKHYMFMDLRESEWALPQLEALARRYAHKLLVPYESLI
jgi:hypothetical protein